jgi:hypothetical protein
MSGPSGIFISKILIMSIMENSDKLPENRPQAFAHYRTFLIINALIVTIMILPSLIFIQDKPPSPPSMVAVKPRPNYGYKTASKLIFTNWNYVLIFVHF